MIFNLFKRDLTRLLKHDEILYLIHAYDLIDRNKGEKNENLQIKSIFSLLDGYIVLDEFLLLQYDKTMPDGLELFVQHNYDLAKRYFSLMDSRQKGVVAWSDFVLLYSCKLIAVKDKVNIRHKRDQPFLVPVSFRNKFWGRSEPKIFWSRSRDHFARG